MKFFGLIFLSITDVWFSFSNYFLRKIGGSWWIDFAFFNSQRVLAFSSHWVFINLPQEVHRCPSASGRVGRSP